MKFLLPLLALALTTTGWAQIDDPHFKTVDEATNKSVREFFKHYEQLYNLHKAHELAAYFGDGGVMHPPRRRIRLLADADGYHSNPWQSESCNEGRQCCGRFARAIAARSLG
jgi:hypothetical protein